MSDLEGIRPLARVTRIGRRPNPWAWPPWEAQDSDNTFGNRWDDRVAPGHVQAVHGGLVRARNPSRFPVTSVD